MKVETAIVVQNLNLLDFEEFSELWQNSNDINADHEGFVEGLSSEEALDAVLEIYELATLFVVTELCPALIITWQTSKGPIVKGWFNVKPISTWKQLPLPLKSKKVASLLPAYLTQQAKPKPDIIALYSKHVTAILSDRNGLLHR